MSNVLEFKEIIEKITEVKLLDKDKNMIGFAAVSDNADSDIGRLCEDAVFTSPITNAKVYQIVALFTEGNDHANTKSLLDALINKVDPKGIYVMVAEDNEQSIDFVSSIGFINLNWVGAIEQLVPMVYISNSTSIVVSYLQDKYEKEYPEVIQAVSDKYDMFTKGGRCYELYQQLAVNVPTTQDELQKKLSDKCLAASEINKN